MADMENFQNRRSQRRRQYSTEKEKNASNLSPGQIVSSPPSANRSVSEGSSASQLKGSGGGGKSGRKGRAQVELPNRPTAFEVWNARQQATKAPLPKPPKVLTEDELTGLVEHLYSTWKTSDSKLKQSQAEAKRQEEETCKPIAYVNPSSAKIAAHLESMMPRTAQKLAEKEQALERQRKLKKEAEMQECTFAPQIKLTKMMAQGRSRDDLVEFAREREERRLQRQHAIQALESRELLFSPQLNQTSVKIQERMKREGRITKDKQTGISLIADTNRSKQSDPNNSECYFIPQLNEKNASYAPDDPDVYNRLFSHAVAKNQQHQGPLPPQGPGQPQVPIPPQPDMIRRRSASPSESIPIVDGKTSMQMHLPPGDNRLKPRIQRIPSYDAEDKEPVLLLQSEESWSSDESEDLHPVNVVEYTDDFEFLIKKIHVWQYAL